VRIMNPRRFSPTAGPPVSPAPNHNPCGRPGRRAPHVWIRTGGKRESTIDLFGRGFVLLTGPNGLEYVGVMASTASGLGVPIHGVPVLQPEWQVAYGVATDGAVLVGPDEHVGKRAPSTHGLTPRQVQSVFSRLLCRENR
jgi:putative polyketide hydroxylase